MLAVMLLFMVTLPAGYVWGIPAVTKWVAFKVPEPMLMQLGRGTLRVLDRTMFEPSALTELRQHELRSRFERIAVLADIKSRHTILFQKIKGVGAYALAIPDGTIVVTDELVRLAKNDEEIIAILAHELGHINGRHSLRMLIRSSTMAFIVAWYIGDVSNIAAALPALLMQTRYLRYHELEADSFGTAMLKASGIAPRHLSDMLAKLEAVHGAQQSNKEKSQSEQQNVHGPVSSYYSLHPLTDERIRALEQ